MFVRRLYSFLCEKPINVFVHFSVGLSFCYWFLYAYWIYQFFVSFCVTNIFSQMLLIFSFILLFLFDGIKFTFLCFIIFSVLFSATELQKGHKDVLLHFLLKILYFCLWWLILSQHDWAKVCSGSWWNITSGCICKGVSRWDEVFELVD